MILQGHNLALACFAGGTLCFSASNMGVWFAKTRPSPHQLGYKKIIDDNANKDDLFDLIVKEHKDRLTKRFGSNSVNKEEVKSWCINNQEKPWVNDFEDVKDFCYIPKKVAYRLITEGYKFKNGYPSTDDNGNNTDCTRKNFFEDIVDSATTTNYYKVRGNCMELKVASK